MKTEEINSIKMLTRIYYDYQKERIALAGKLGIKKNGEVKKDVPERDPIILVFIKKRYDDVYAFEKEIEKKIAKIIREHPLWKNFLKDIKGVGELMAAVIISEFDIHKWEKVSNGWSFAGLAPGKDKKVKGKTCPYNQFLKSKLLGVLGKGFIMSNSPYRMYYDNMRSRLESKNWGIESKNPTNKNNKKAGHQHRAAIRYMVKMFLKDLYVAWRTIEGLKVYPPYQESYLGHVHKKTA